MDGPTTGIRGSVDLAAAEGGGVGTIPNQTIAWHGKTMLPKSGMWRFDSRGSMIWIIVLLLCSFCRDKRAN